MSALTWLAHLAKPGERRPMIVVECVVNDIAHGLPTEVSDEPGKVLKDLTFRCGYLIRFYEPNEQLHAPVLQKP